MTNTMGNSKISEEIVNKIIEWINKEKISELDTYLLQNDCSLKDINNSNFDILIYCIQNNASDTIINYLIEKLKYPNFNYCISENNTLRSPLFLAIGYNNFNLANFLLKNNKADINYLNGEILFNLYRQKLLNKKNLRYIIQQGYNVRHITYYIVQELVKNAENELLEIILTSFKYDTRFILKLINLHKTRNSITNKHWKRLIQEERAKIEIDERMYEELIQAKNYDMVRILYENESHRDRQILQKIVKYNMLEVAVKSNKVPFVEKVLSFVPFNYKYFNYETIFTECIGQSKNREMAKLLITSFIKNSNANHGKKEGIERKGSRRRSTLEVNDSNETININDLDTTGDDGVVPSKKYCTIFGMTVHPEYVILVLNLIIKQKDLLLTRYIVEEMEEPAQWLNRRDIFGDYPLITSFYVHDFEIFKYLLEKGASGNVKNDQGMSIVSLMIQDKNRRWFDYLIEGEEDLHIHEKDTNGNTPLMMAVYQNNSGLVERLMEYAEDHDLLLEVNDPNPPKDSLLFQAIHQDNIDMVILLTDYAHNHHLDLNLRDLCGDTPLTLAYHFNKKDLFHYLVQFLDVNQTDGKGKTLIFYAIDRKDEPTIKYLVNIGADLNVKDPSSSDTVLHYAIRNGTVTILKDLLQRKNLDVNEKNAEGETPMLSLMKCGRYSEEEKKEIITQLLQQGSNVNITDRFSNSLLYYSLEKEYDLLTELLMDNGAMINPDAGKVTFQMMRNLIKGDNLNLLKLMMRNFDVNTQDKENGNTLLHVAINYRFKPIIKYLVKDCQANKSIKNNKGYNVYQWNDYLHYNLLRDEINSLLNSS